MRMLARLVACFGVTCAAPSITSGQTQVLNLAWDASPSPNISDYYVYVGTAPGNYNVLAKAVVPGSQTSFAFAATPGVGYYFAVSAVSFSGGEGALSSEIRGGVPTLSQPANQTGIVGTAITALSLIGSDPDGGVLHYTATGLPPGLVLNTTTGLITGTPTIAGAYNVTAAVSDGISSTQRSFVWTIAPGVATVTVSIANPSSGIGLSQTFSLTYTDSLGAADLVTASVLFNDTLATTPANACMVSYNPGTNLVSMLDDAGTSWASGHLGDPTTLRNGQCSAALFPSSAVQSGNNLTLTLSMTFKPTYRGAKNAYLYAASAGGQDSGWVDRGDWTVLATAAMTGDYDGDRRTDVSVYRPSTGVWYGLRSSTDFTAFSTTQWGVTGDIPIDGDFDGDGTSDISVYRPSIGVWYILQSSSSFTTWISRQWGQPGDRPVPADYDGDTRTDVAVYRPTTGVWYIVQSSTDHWVSYQFGWADDVPVAGDYDGDTRADVAVYRPSTGAWYVLQSSTNSTNWVSYQWGQAGDVPVAADYDGDGTLDFAVFRPSSGFWYIALSSTSNTTYRAFPWGWSTDVPEPGDYDGDGQFDLAVYRPADGDHYIVYSSSSAQKSIHWGMTADISLLRRP